ncbi:MAG TPA: GTPase HflX [Hyphomicrobiaceae bacterium]|nr:GTPase HflX [Hyphomicrobiaceae bacterium]
MLVPALTARRSPRPPNGDRARDQRLGASHSTEDRLEEARGLAEAIDLDVCHAGAVPLPSPRPATLFGSGKVREIGELVRSEEADLVIIDHAVSPVQQRNLETAWNCKVLDRTGLILEIFGRRAHTREGRLQVELAHLTYQRSRLVRSWTHLERQRGGYGFLGGPGETQIETDRRLLQERIDKIRDELKVVVKTRALHRSGRRRVPYPIVAIVGYTNAGKSTLFNRITGAGVLAVDQVFATLDPTMREVALESGRRLILSDTVGFISELPTMLVAAFRATLEEVVEADLVLHVRDISHAEREAQRLDVERVLKDLGIDALAPDTKVLEVWNKIDRLDAREREEIENSARRALPRPVLVSAVSGEGVADLLQAIDERLATADEVVTLEVPTEAGGLISWLHRNGEVLGRETTDAGHLILHVRVDAATRGKLQGQMKRAGLAAGADQAHERD